MFKSALQLFIPSRLYSLEHPTPFVKLPRCVMVMSFETSFSIVKPLPMYIKKKSISDFKKSFC